MITEIMKGRKAADFKGRVLKRPRPKFVFVNQYDQIIEAKAGFLVEIQKCKMLEFGRALIVIDIIKKVEIFSVKERDMMDIGLYDAYVRKFY